MDENFTLDTRPMVGKLKDFKPLVIQLVNKTELEPVWDYMVRNYHYLGYETMIGPRIKYMALHHGRPIAAISFNRAALTIGVRDKYLDWTREQKYKLLSHVINNNRFLILPWVKIRYLASHLLARSLKLLMVDWPAMYGTEPYLVETFVDRDKYRGTCYYAANWHYLGETRGFGKVGKTFVYHGKQKGVFIYMLNRQFLRIIAQDPCRRPDPNTVRKRIPNMMLHKPDWNPDILAEIGVTEQEVLQLGSLLDEYLAYFEDCYSRSQQRDHGEAFVKGLLSNLDRKSIEPIALRYQDEKAVRPMQFFMKTSPWNEQKMLELYQQRLASQVNDPEGMVNADSSDFVKKGIYSVGVHRQYCGVMGKTENCQSGVYVGYSGSNGYGLLDRRLYLPEKWFDEEHKKLWEECLIPEDTTFKTKPQLAADMINKILSSGLFQARWVGCDCAFGGDKEFRDALPKTVWFFADIHAKNLVWRQHPEWVIPEYKGRGKKPEKPIPSIEPVPVSSIAADDSLPWQTIILAEGTKGPIIAKVKWCRIFECRGGELGEELWLYVRQYEDGRIKYAWSNAPVDIPVEQLHRAATLRWPIEQCFEECKSFLGMDNYEARSWPAWHRHMLFVFIAHLFILELRIRFKKN